MLPRAILAPARRAVRFSLVMAVAASTLLSPAMSANAKTIGLTGIVDCGRSSGKRCNIGDTLSFRTKDLSGVTETIELDVSWIKEDLEGTDQDDLLTFEVEEKPGGYQVLRIVSSDVTVRQQEEDDSRNDTDEQEEEQEE
jgi:hypothetical protein